MPTAPLETIGSGPGGGPDWVKLKLGEVTDRVPVRARRSLRGRHARARPGRGPGARSRTTTRPASSSACTPSHEDTPAAEAYLDALRERSRTRTNPFKNRVLETVSHRDGPDLPRRHADGVDRATTSCVPGQRVGRPRPQRPRRSTPRSIGWRRPGWRRNRGHPARGPAGHGQDRPVPCARQRAGGLGHRHLLRRPDDARTTSASCTASSKHLAPALVVMEDVDLVVGDRSGGAGPPCSTSSSPSTVR